MAYVPFFARRVRLYKLQLYFKKEVKTIKELKDYNTLLLYLGAIFTTGGFALFFGGTIRENILYGNRHASEEQLIEACKNANIYDFVLISFAFYISH